MNEIQALRAEVAEIKAILLAMAKQSAQAPPLEEIQVFISKAYNSPSNFVSTKDAYRVLSVNLKGFSSIHHVGRVLKQHGYICVIRVIDGRRVRGFAARLTSAAGQSG